MGNFHSTINQIGSNGTTTIDDGYVSYTGTYLALGVGGERTLKLQNGRLETDDYMDGYTYLGPWDALWSDPDVAGMHIANDGEWAYIPAGEAIYFPIRLPRDSIIYDMELSAAANAGGTIQIVFVLNKRPWYDYTFSMVAGEVHNATGTTEQRFALHNINEEVADDYLYYLIVAPQSADTMRFIGARFSIGWKHYDPTK